MLRQSLQAGSTATWAMPVQSHRQRIIWQRAIELCVAVDEVTLPTRRGGSSGRPASTSKCIHCEQHRRGLWKPVERTAQPLSRHRSGGQSGIADPARFRRATGLCRCIRIEKAEALSFEVGKMLTALPEKASTSTPGARFCLVPGLLYPTSCSLGLIPFPASA